ncbi:unnamed protein product [Caenorhabditis nigoni]
MYSSRKIGCFLSYGSQCYFSKTSQLLKVSRVLKKTPKNKYSLTPKFWENLKSWPKLLDAEVDSQHEKLNEMIQNKTNWKEIEARGCCIGNLVVNSQYYDVTCGNVVELSGNTISSARWLRNGIPVSLNRIDEDGVLKKVTEGHIAGLTYNTIKFCAYENNAIDPAIETFVLTPSANGGALRFIKGILRDPTTLSSDSVHLINLAYRTIPMPSIHDRKMNNLPKTLNPSQQAAVSAALNPQRNLLCIQGPPGTGKTRVIAEIVHQLLKKKKKVLICAPTHVAVQNAMDAVRRRMCQDISPEIVQKELCILNSTRDEFQDHPSTAKLESMEKELMRSNQKDQSTKLLSYECMKLRCSIYQSIYAPRRAIFSTLGTSSIQKLPEYDWKADVMIVDEAAQCTEPSTWVPALTTPTCKKLVLVGDQKQLPAIVLSDKAIRANFSLSLMEKLAEEFSKNNINILLNEQYRMNEKIMHWSNEHFYNNQLTAHSSVSDITLRDIYPKIPTDYIANKPIFMIDMKNFEDRSQESFDSKSYSNTGELNVVSNYVIRLVTDVGINPKDIAVIAPYYSQIEKLRNSISFRVDVNTVDAFQGQEREVIIFCFVRDNDEGSIGFLRETRRLNVAITRAKRQFVLVGNSDMLQRNRHVRSLYRYLKSEKVIYGPEIFDTFDDIGLPEMDKKPYNFDFREH